MATSSSSAPSSSAVPIPRPGKSILKPPAPPPRPLFSLSTFSKFLPNQQQETANGNNNVGLRRAHFIMPQLVTVYPISSSNPPSMPTTKEEKKLVEDKERDRRRRVMRGNSFSTPVGTPISEHPPLDDWWTADKVASFYNECCTGREEEPNPHIVAALRAATTTKPRSLDLTGIQLTAETTNVLTDLLNVEWGVRKLVLKKCDLTDTTIKPLLHALLIPCSITFFSIASNRQLKAPGFRVLGAYIEKFLDLSETNLDKKSVDYIVAALGSIPPQQPNGEYVPAPGAHSSLESLRLDDCSLRAGALESLAHAVRNSALKNISMRSNKIGSSGAVALALMIKDYPDSAPVAMGITSIVSPPSTPVMSPSPSEPSSPVIGILPPPPRQGPIAPPPRHPSAAPVATTYTPYVPRARRGTAPTSGAQPLAQTRITFAPPDRTVPVITSSREGGITTRHAPPPAAAADDGPSAALMDKVRALASLPKLGALRTLDLRNNDIRNGVTYIAQVLKRNRTLKVLNLSENKIDVQGLIAIAESLKYNACLETLDLSKNPCCAPASAQGTGLEGITSLRTAFTLNKSLKRLFLSGTGLTTAGAIALAEFLPESLSLLHLDLTQNSLDIAAVMALSSGLRANWVMRCLDLNIPVGDEHMARLCRDILSICVRNTEKAEEGSRAVGAGAPTSGRGLGKGVWGMIEESQLARSIRRTAGETLTQTDLDIIQAARDCRADLESVVTAGTKADAELVARTRAALPPLIGLIQALGGAPAEAERLLELIELNDALTNLLTRAAPTSPAITRRSSLQGGLRLRLGSNVLSAPNGMLGPGSPAGQLLSPLLRKTSGTFTQSPNGSNGTVDSVPEEGVTTPKIDKGKGRLIIEEKVIPSANFAIGDSDEEDKHLGGLTLAPDGDDPGLSPTEGEVFRKGVALLKPEEMEEEYDTEELRTQLLSAEVERHPMRQYDQYGAPIDEAAMRGQQMATSVEESEQFDTVAASTPLPQSPVVSNAAGGSRPAAYQRRSSTSSLSQQLI
ncbi:RNI-like protein [Auriculariales sp. MPI-PUGE-AT-0066]|nr:RNI-like protein [Auriculariales sp. MPI-PUGE-AT-0066]